MIFNRFVGIIIGLLITATVFFTSLKKKPVTESLSALLVGLYLTFVYTFIWLPWGIGMSSYRTLAEANWIPFRYLITEFSFTIFKDTIVNFLAFVPIGVCFAFMKGKTTTSSVISLIAIGATAEVIQLILCIISKYMYRSIDITDLILNVLGGLLAYYLIKYTSNL